MNRREFIKLSAITAAVVISNAGHFARVITSPAQVRVGDKIFKGSQDGKILTSQDSGKTWQVHALFGEEVSVMDLTMDDSDQVYAQMGFRGFIFHLKLTQDGRNWVSV